MKRLACDLSCVHTNLSRHVPYIWSVSFSDHFSHKQNIKLLIKMSSLVITHASDACLRHVPTACVSKWEAFLVLVYAIHMNIMLVRGMKNHTYMSWTFAIFNKYNIIKRHEYDYNINDKNENSVHHLYTWSETLQVSI